MDTKPLEKFCPWARTTLIEAVDLRCRRFALDPEGLAATPADADVVAGRVLSPQEKVQRAKLAERIGASGYAAFCERMAYTWFNRFAAIRYMELHDYLSCHVRMLSAAEDGAFNPDCLRQAADLGLPGLDATCALQLMAASEDEELFRRVIVAQCNELAECLPEVFGQVDDADALTLPDGLLRQGEHDFLYHLVADIPEESWQDVEVLGWMYQFYNSERKEDFFKSKRKAEAADIAPATQLFTPEWIVRYMVENSLGRLWMLNRPDSRLRDRMEYYVEPDAEHEDFIRVESPEDITLCDPACGSGHILSYAFELLFAIYEECGYTAREIPELILTKNLSGYEVDGRAAQISSLVLALRAREHDRRFFRREVRADVRVLESVPLEEGEADVTKELAEELTHLGEVGSLLAPTDADVEALRAGIASCEGDLFAAATKDRLERALEACEALRRRFDVVVANPPYMSSSRFNPFMSGWIKKNYPDVKSDLFSSFIVRIMAFANPHGGVGIMCPFVWMFIGSYEKLRNLLIDEKTLTSLIQLEYSGFAGATVPICTFTFHNSKIEGYKGGYIRLSDFVGANVQAPKALEAIKNPTCGWFYRRDASTFHQIPGSPIAYWASEGLFDSFSTGKPIYQLVSLSGGLKTGNNEKYLRLWWEVSLSSTSFANHANCTSSFRWCPCNKGGSYRKWSGNDDYVVDWKDNGRYMFGHAADEGRSVNRIPEELAFKPHVTWSKITSSKQSFRFKPHGHLFETAGPSLFGEPDVLEYLQGFLNSRVSEQIAEFLSPTLNCNPNEIANMPLISPGSRENIIKTLVDDSRMKSQSDWDSLETSWDFKRSSLL